MDQGAANSGLMAFQIDTMLAQPAAQTDRRMFTNIETLSRQLAIYHL
jgi:hypothetical protein